MDQSSKKDISLAITGYTLQCNGSGTVQNEIYEVPFILPGEHGIVTPVKKSGKRHYAIPKNITLPSSLRTSPHCTHFTSCAACHLQHVSYEESIRIKHKVFYQTLCDTLAQAHIPLEEIPTISIRGAQHHYEYRNTSRFDVVSGRIMYHEILTHKQLPLQKCFTISKQQLAYIHQLQGKLDQSITEIEFKENKLGELMIIFTGVHPNNLPHIPNASVYFLQATTKELEHISGNPTLIHNLNIANTSFSFHIGPRSFFQVHTQMAEVLFDLVYQHTPKTGTILDLYAGTGTIGIILAGLIPNIHVESYEINEEMVHMGNLNKELNGLTNITLHCVDVRKQRFTNTPECIIIDPPRKGLAKESLEHLLGLGAKTIIYVSCSAQTFVRDSIFLFPQYTLSHIHLVDMTPWTSHMEIVSVWIRRG